MTHLWGTGTWPLWPGSLSGHLMFQSRKNAKIFHFSCGCLVGGFNSDSYPPAGVKIKLHVLSSPRYCDRILLWSGLLLAWELCVPLVEVVSSCDLSQDSFEREGTGFLWTDWLTIIHAEGCEVCQSFFCECVFWWTVLGFIIHSEIWVVDWVEVRLQPLIKTFKTNFYL